MSFFNQETKLVEGEKSDTSKNWIFSGKNSIDKAFKNK